MAQFLELENGNFFNASKIMELRSEVKVNINSSKKCKVIASIKIYAENGMECTLVSGFGDAPWMDSDREVGIYGTVCMERDAAEIDIREYFPYIARMIMNDKLLYFSPENLQEELQTIAKKAAERIVYAAHKGETEDE